MAWLEKLDARARRWPKPAFWAYLSVKWYLVLVGALVMIKGARQGMPLALGFVATVIASIGAGIATAIAEHRRNSM